MSLKIISALLCQRIGINLEVIGDRAISRAIEARRLACRLPSIEVYLQQLQNSEPEFDELVEQIVIPETSFFRDRKPFDFLVDHIRSQELTKDRLSKLRILSAPCSTGEEPYSIAIALLEAGLSSHQFTIDAIDISRVAIDKAKRAIYCKNSFRGADWVNRNQYFLKVNDSETEQYEVSPQVRMMVKFRQENLLNAFAVSGNASKINQKYDIIFCRNLLIYLEASVCQKLFKLFYQMLAPDGLLFVGSSETSKVPPESFEFLRKSFTFAYRKRSTTSDKIIEPKRQNSNTINAKIHLMPLPARASPSAIEISTPAKANVSTSIPTSFPETRNIQESIPKLDVEFQQVQEWANSGQLELAIHACQKYLTENLTHAEAHKLLGTLYQAIGNHSEAERYFQKTLYLNPYDDEALMNLALLQTARGDQVGADRFQKRLQQRLQRSPQP